MRVTTIQPGGLTLFLCILVAANSCFSKVTTAGDFHVGVGIRVPERLPYENKESSLPATITVQCVSPSAEAAENIEQAVRTIETPGVDGEIRIAAQPSDDRSAAMQLNMNWTPQGPFKVSALAVTEWLREKGCSDFVYRLESGLGNVHAD